MMQNSMYLNAHFKELKSRILKILIFLFISFIIAFYFKNNLFNILALPLNDILNTKQNFIYTQLTEVFFVYLKIAFWGALFISIPFILSQIYLFMAPGLYKNEKKFIIPIIIFSCALFYSGIAFVYFYLMPKAWGFFISFSQQNSDILLQAKISEYFSLSLSLMLAFGLAFQLPIVLLVLNKIGLINVDMLIKCRKYAILIIAIISAILTPPDIISQIALVVPLFAMYEITILLLKINKSSKIKK